VALDIDKRTSDSGSATAMLNFGGKFMGKRTWIRPSLRVGYRNEFINDGVITTGRFVGGTTPFNILGLILNTHHKYRAPLAWGANRPILPF